MTPHSSTQQLTEYISAVSAPADETSAVDAAVRCALATFSAEVCAAVVEQAVRGYLGPDNSPPPLGLVGVQTGATSLAVDGLGTLHAAVAHTDKDPHGALIVAREQRPFSADEHDLLSAMARALGLALRGLRTLATGRTMLAAHERDSDERLRLLSALGTRQRLLETVLNIQRSISNRKPLQEILDTVTASAASLLDRAAVTLVLPDSGSGGLRPASYGGPSERIGDSLVLAAAADSIEASCVVARTDDGGGDADRYRSIVAAPVVIRGVAAGSLAAETGNSHGYAVEQRELLTAFAQQVSLALTEAKTADAMHEAQHDTVTGLPNRALFLERLSHAIEAGNKRVADVTILLIDLHRFKAINDSLGHKAGDAVLAAVAKRISANLRSGDVVARVGGDEFGVLLEGAGGVVGARAARSIIDAIREPLRISGRSVCLSACIGVAASCTSSADSGDLFNSADLAMNRAVMAGPGRIEIYEPHMHAEIRERINLLDDLQTALARTELRLQYQPLVDLETGRPVGVEALARWRHPQRGEVSPATFIPLAEETGLILDLGLWILREGCRQVAEWRDVLPDIRLNINVSARQVLDPDFATGVAQALADVGLPSPTLTLELTETMLMGDPEQAVVRLGQLKSLGVHLSIDDFGTGYSSLSYLQQFPVDQIKIDQTFVSGATTSENQLAVARTVMDLGRTLRLETVAEGIEDDQQLQLLRDLGCDLGQGFLLARPMEAAAVPDYFRHPVTRR
ncbi:MAG: EAL domain-containing protein [Dactylosporangium sp.]|nr:EAL domain-containing protein [Dactylosporangium sp.]NNJ61817.1 EAL domain-containing protein [Dactylosporangium sp.]